MNPPRPQPDPLDDLIRHLEQNYPTSLLTAPAKASLLALRRRLLLAEAEIEKARAKSESETEPLRAATRTVRDYFETSVPTLGALKLFEKDADSINDIVHEAISALESTHDPKPDDDYGVDDDDDESPEDARRERDAEHCDAMCSSYGSDPARWPKDGKP